MPGPGGGLLDMMGVPAAAVAPPEQQMRAAGGVGFGYNVPNGAPGIPLYSGGGIGAMGMGGGGGGAVFSPPQDLAGYFDQYGRPRMDDPRKVAADAGVSLADLARGMLPGTGGGVVNGMAGASNIPWISYNPPNDKGGFFSIEDLYNTTRQPTAVGGPLGPGGRPSMSMQRAANVPVIATADQQLPSTNNWRLLGRGPGWIMRNGRYINMQAPETSRGGYLGADLGFPDAEFNAATSPNHSLLGTGAFAGMPNNWRSMTGWPGQENPYVADRWPLHSAGS